MPVPHPAPTPSRRRMLGLGGLAALAAAPLTACSGLTGSSLRSGQPAGKTVDVRRFGAKGDGVTDDSAAIQRAITSLRAGDTLSFPAGRVFCHDSVLAVHTAGVRLAGPGTIKATAEERSALRIEAADVQLHGLKLQMGETTRRWSSTDQHKLYLAAHSGIVVSDVSIMGSAAAGLFSYGATDFRLERVRVRDTRADGIHLTNGTRRGVVERPYVTNSGDDGVAVVSYLQDPTPCSDITVRSPVVRTTSGGRGVSVVGGHDVTYSNVTISASSAAAVYLACEGGDFVTHPTRRVKVTGGRVVGANTDAGIDHGAVLVYSGRAGGTVSDVTVSGLTISGTRSGASRQIGVVVDGPQDLVSDVVFRDLRLASEPTPYQGNAPLGPIALDDVRADGSPVRLG